MSKSAWVLVIAGIAFGYWYEVLRPKQTGTATNANTVPPVNTNPSTLPIGLAVPSHEQPPRGLNVPLG